MGSNYCCQENPEALMNKRVKLSKPVSSYAKTVNIDDSWFHKDYNELL